MKILIVALLSIITPTILASFSISRLTSWLRNEVTGNMPRVLRHSCNQAPPADKSFKFLAFFVTKLNCQYGTDCTPVGSAAVVTNTLAVTAASVIDQFPNIISEMVLLTGGFGRCYHSICRTEHSIREAKSHPLYEQRPSFADIAVVYLSSPILMTVEGVVPIPLRLEDVDEGLIVSQLGWDDPDDILTDFSREQNHWRWDTAWRRFHVVYHKPTCSYLFKSGPEYNMTLGDFGGPVFMDEQEFLLVGITPALHNKDFAEFVKIHNFLPFLAKEIQIDRSLRPGDEANDPEEWIANLLDKFIHYPPETIL